MSISALTLYVLIWPAIVALVLAVICMAFYKEWRAAKDEGRRII